MEDSQNWFDQGLAFLEEENYSDAISAFDKAITYNQSPKDAWFNRGLAFAQMGNYLKALQSFDQTISLDPGYENAKKARSVVLAQMEKQKNTIPAPAPSSPLTGSYKAAPAAPKKDPSPTRHSIRNPLIAVIFSFLFPGWGQWYNGRRWDGLIFFGVAIILGVLNIALRLVLVNYQILLSIIFGILGLAVLVYGMYNAYTTAESINRGEIGFTRKSRLFWLPIVVLILMVALLIVALGFAFMIFGSAAQSAHQAKVVTATAQQPDVSHIVVTYLGGRDAYDVSQVTIVVTNPDGDSLTEILGEADDKTPLKIGSQVTFTGRFAGRDHVVATAKFMDNTKQVILDSYV
jgi:hypothetical protein